MKGQRNSSWQVRLLGALACLCLAACSSKSSGGTELPCRAEFGVFFGGQIQNREVMELVVDSTRQVQGFRLTFPRPLARPTEVTWELDVPLEPRGRRGPGSARRQQRPGRVILPAGRERFEQLIPLTAADVPGTWNMRVSVDRVLVLDRCFRMTAASRNPAAEL